MRVILAICLSTLIAGGLLIWNALRWPNQYGTFTGATQTETAMLIGKPTDFIGKTVTVAGTVREQCNTMGCFFYFYAGNKKLRVELKDIAMKAPRREGHSARVEGQLESYIDGYQLLAAAVKFE
ncbi:MAG TPA: hypothetical protein VKB49_23110 [Candidatus Sulfotelmatobacter sp.]|nr:hypothetical protein [Candidatus Sulfotelmatobacter sp.]